MYFFYLRSDERATRKSGQYWYFSSSEQKSKFLYHFELQKNRRVSIPFSKYETGKISNNFQMNLDYSKQGGGSKELVNAFVGFNFIYTLVF